MSCSAACPAADSMSAAGPSPAPRSGPAS
jgi:hypothetical protein